MTIFRDGVYAGLKGPFDSAPRRSFMAVTAKAVSCKLSRESARIHINGLSTRADQIGLSTAALVRTFLVALPESSGQQRRSRTGDRQTYCGVTKKINPKVPRLRPRSPAAAGSFTLRS